MAESAALPMEAATGLQTDAVGSEAEVAGQTIGESMEDGVRESLDMHSPSRVMEELGLDAVSGFQLGLDREPPSISQPTIHLDSPPMGLVAQSSPGPLSITINPTITIQLPERRRDERVPRKTRKPSRSA